MENRDFAKGFARSKNMENLLLAVKGHLEDFHLAACHHEKADTRVTLVEDRNTFSVVLARAYPADFTKLFRRQSAEQEAVCQQFVLVTHVFSKKIVFLI